MPEHGSVVTAWTATPAYPKIPSLGILTGAAIEPGTGDILAWNLAGRVYRWPNNSNAVIAPFLDISDRTFNTWGDSGFLNLVFHPEFGQPESTNRGFIYVWYSHHPNPPSPIGSNLYRTHTNRLSRFTVSDGSTVADPNSELILIQQEDRHITHAGGGMFFGPDGFLYLAVSDEGTSYDSLESAQQIDENLFSGVLRIDVDMQGGNISHPIPRQPERGITAHYFIPNDNPWVGEDGVLEEFYAIGLRNPHRMTLDAETGQAWIGDVGQAHREEVNWLVRGANYQWPFREGTQIWRTTPDPIIGTEQPPAYEYERQIGVCVIGGFIYRGEKHHELLGGKYIFGDVSGAIWAAEYSGGKLYTPELLTKISGGLNVITAFTMDPAGEILVVTLVDGLMRLDYQTEEVTFPATLSETGVLVDTSAFEPAGSFIPYGVISPLWSDGAQKRRWMSVPFNAGAPTEKNFIEFSAEGAWQFPPGTVFVKHFELQTNTMDPDAIRRLETRILVKQKDEGVYGVTYRWRPDGTEADVVLEPESEEIAVTTPEGVRHQTWVYPGVNDCLTCHTPDAGYVLGVNTRQLNHPVISTTGGDSANQVSSLATANYFSNPPAQEEFATMPALVDPLGEDGSLHDRVRSYLDANCAHCHLPGGTRARFDARFDVPLHAQALIQGEVLNDLGVHGSKVASPRDPNRSVLLQRMKDTGDIKMPPLARNLVDAEAAALIERWINAMPTIDLIEPAGNYPTHPEGAQVQATADFSEIPGSHFDFYLDGAPITNSGPAFASFPLPALSEGEHELTAVLHDAEGGRYTASQTFEADDTIPLVRVVSPESTVVPTSGFFIYTEASSSIGGEIGRVRVFLDDSIIGEASTNRWGGSRDQITAGVHRVQVEATDSSGEVGYGSLLFRAAYPPTIAFGQEGAPLTSLLLLRENLAADIQRANDSRVWVGYPSKPGPIVTGLPDPLGGFGAIELPGADLGGSEGYSSGLSQPADQPWPDSAPGAQILISVWMRAVNEGFPVSFGIAEGTAKEVELTTDWQQFSTIISLEDCDCSEVETIFHVAENVEGAGAWQIASPEVYILTPVEVPLHASQQDGSIAQIELWMDGTLAGTFLGDSLPELPLTEFGTFSLTARALTSDGLWSETPPLTLTAGPKPRLSWEGTPPQLTLKGFPGLPYGLQGSADLVTWTNTSPRKLEDYKEFLNEEVSRLKSQFFRLLVMPDGEALSNKPR